MEFFNLFILQLKFWPRSLGPADSDPRPDLFSFPILNLQIFNLLLQHLLAFDLLPLPLYLWPPWAFGGHITSYVPKRLSPTSTFQDQHLPVPFAKPILTSSFCKADIY